MRPRRRMLGLETLTLAAFLVGVPLKVAAQDAKLKLASLPLAFERNEGQAPAPYQFLASRGGMETFFLADGLDIVVSGPKSTASHLHIRWSGENPGASLSSEELLPGHSNYLLGSDSLRWLHDISQFAQLRYKQLYPGIDLVFHGLGERLEHDFVLQPGADAARISFHLDQAVKITRAGDLIIDLGNSNIHFFRPVAYQGSGKSKKEVSAEFLIARNGDIKFKLGTYDHTKALVIDPVFGFSTYLDGSNADSINAVTTDSAGNVYVAGFTGSTDFPITNANNPLCAPCSDVNQSNEAFVSKIDPTGHTLLYSTFLGGSSGALAYSIAVDKNGNIYLAGVTSSADFPNTGGVQSPAPAINTNQFFVASIRADGSSLNYSGRIGGAIGFSTNGNQGLLATDSSGNAYLTGVTDDAHFQLTPNTIGPTPIGYPIDTAFVLKVNSTGQLVYSTLIPGNAPVTPGVGAFNNNFPAAGITVDVNGQVTLAGLAGLGLPTTPGVVQGTFPNTTNASDPGAGYVLQLNATASKLNFATYLTGTDIVGGLAVDALGNYYVAGMTSEQNLPVNSTTFQKSIVPNQLCTCNAGYVLKLDPKGISIPAATYLSGSGGANFRGIALDNHSNVLVGGVAFSADFPLKNPLVATFETSETAAAMVLAQLDANLSSLLFGSFLSSTNPTTPLNGSNFSGLTVDANNNAIIVGTTLASDFPTTQGSFQLTPPPPSNPLVGFQHSFISKLDLATLAPSVCLSPASINFGAILVGTPASLNLNITNCGNADLQLSSAVSSVPSIVPAHSCGMVTAGSMCSLQLTFTPVDSSVVSGTLTLKDNAAIPQQTISLSGKGGVPQIFFPPSFSAADLLAGTHAEYPLVFVNTGDGNWIVNKVAATGDFSVDNQCTAPVPGFSASGLANVCFIGVIFSPTQPGLRTGSLTITDNAAGSPHVIPLSGNSLVVYATPSISSIIAVPTDAQQPTLQITGNNFFPTSQVLLNGSARTTHYESEVSLTADLTASDLAQTGEVSVTVANPRPGGGLSNHFEATIYAAIRNVSFLHTVFDPHSGHLFASVSTNSLNHANQVVVIDPATAQILSAFTVGNGPNQLAVSDDGQFLYVGLDGDRKVAQVSLPAGTVNFSAGLGNDPDFNNPMVADAIRVLPGHSHSWAVTLCGVGFVPCGEGICVFDDAVQRPTRVFQNQLEPDALTFVGQDATNLYGTTLLQAPSTFYKFAIASSGISLSQTVTNFAGTSPGGGTLDSDGTSIFVSNGQVIDPTTLAIKSDGFQPQSFSPAIKVDVPASRVYFAGGIFPSSFQIQAFELLSQKLSGSISMFETGTGQEMHRWGTNGLAINLQSAILLVRTSLTSSSVSVPQFFVTGLIPLDVRAGSADLSLTITGSGFATGDSVAANGTPLQVISITPTQITATVPAALLSVAGDIQIIVTDVNNHVANLVLIVAPELTSVAISTNSLTFGAQVVGVSSPSQDVTLSNTGKTPLTVSSVTATGDFSQSNTCTTVAPSSNCTISVVFKPSAGGNRSGSLAVKDSDFTKMQTIALDGIGSDVQIAGSGNSGTTVTVSAGQSASYSLSLSPEGGFTGQLTFNCSNLPQFAGCSFSPASATIGAAPVNITVTIATSQQQTAALIPHGFSPATAMACVAIFFLLTIGVPRRDLRSMRTSSVMKVVVLGLLLLPLAGCGGGGGASPQPPTAMVTPAGTYKVTFTVASAQMSRSIPLTLVVTK